MFSKLELQNTTDVTRRLIGYNLKIIFANKFFYFFGVAVLLFMIITLTRLVSDDTPTIASVYYLLLLPGLLLVAYPTIFGVQNDADSRMLEIIFGIPNYRYKVWLVRILIIYGVVFLALLGLGLISTFTLIHFNVLNMVFQLLFPIFFIGCLAFMVSTLVRNGNGTAVVMIVVGVAFWMGGDSLETNQWNLFLNPFLIPQDVNETIWSNTIVSNRIILAVSTFVVLLSGLLNLQKREKFLIDH